MDVSAEEDVLVQAKPLFEELTCPVCFEWVKQCVSTPCGHSFCRLCLDECLNVKKSCPSCTAPVDPRAVLANKHFDRLLAILDEQKKKSHSAHFAELLRQQTAPNAGDAGSLPAPANPIQSVFQKHLMKSLSTYEEYLKKLSTVAEKTVVEETAEYESKVAECKKRGGDPNELAKLKARHADKLAGIQRSYSLTEASLKDEYDAFLEKNLVNPSFLPVQVIICIEATGARYPYVLNPTDTLKDVKKFILTKPAVIGGTEPITRVSSSKNSFEIRPPFSHNNNNTENSASIIGEIKSDPSASSSSSNGSSKTGGARVKIEHKHRPLSRHYEILPGSLIVMIGVPITKIQTKECFKTSFDANDPETQKCSFLKCDTCGKNWICKTCAETCHAGHSLSPHVAEQPWKSATCYCPKTKCCKLDLKAAAK